MQENRKPAVNPAKTILGLVPCMRLWYYNRMSKHYSITCRNCKKLAWSRGRIFCSMVCYSSYRTMCPPKFSEKFAADISKRQAASGNSNWKGDKVGYDALHAWIKRHKTKAKMCNDCGLVPPYDLANISQEYKRDLLDWEWLCRKCHMAKDGRLEAFKKMRVGKVARSN